MLWGKLAVLSQHAYTKLGEAQRIATATRVSHYATGVRYIDRENAASRGMRLALIFDVSRRTARFDGPASAYHDSKVIILHRLLRGSVMRQAIGLKGWMMSFKVW